MPTFALYLLKVILCSAVLFGYYHLFLRNKVYHAYNRFYLLATVLVAVFAPFFNFQYLFNGGVAQPKPIRLLQVVNSGDEYLEEIILYSHQNFISLSQAVMILYGVISFLLLAALINVFVQILSILKTNSSKNINDIVFVESNAKGTPFSFFKFIFWNKAIDLHSETGQQIFAHELAHVREKHSVDKLFLNIVLIFCWINPIFWLIKKELNLIHEFIADKKAVVNNDAGALAAMIVTSAYPKHSYLLTNHFFYSPIKRRLQMLSKYNTKKAGYLYRILALPLVVFLVAAFTIKTKSGIERYIHPEKTITVIIDAGHGGHDAGAMAADGTLEKNLNLDILKKIKALNKSSNINLVFTRELDVFQSPLEKAAFIKRMDADLFISIHIATGPSKVQQTVSGLEIYVSNDDQENSMASKLFASSLISHFKNNYDLSVSSNPIQRKVGIAVLKASSIPSVIIEPGYMNNPIDLSYLKSEKGKEKIAQNILNAIAQYADNRKAQRYQSAIVPFKKDTIPSTDNKGGLYKGEEIKSINVSKDCETVQLKLANGKTVFMSLNEAKKQQIQLPKLAGDFVNAISGDLNKDDKYYIDASERTTITGDRVTRPDAPSQSQGVQIKSLSSPGVHPLLIIDGKEMPYAELNNTHPSSIESVNVLKGEAAIKKYGAEKAINGVLEIKTKSTKVGGDTPANSPDSLSKVFTKLDKEAEFPGGKEEWIKYLRKNLNVNQPVDEGWSSGTFTVIVQFVVSKDGTISNVTTEDFKGSKTAQMCIDFIKNGPKWIPGQQNGLAVRSVKKQPITFVIVEQ